MILDTTWYKGQWWDFEDAFGIDDNVGLLKNTTMMVMVILTKIFNYMK